MFERIREALARLFNLRSSALPYTISSPYMPAYSRSDQTGYMQQFGAVGTLFGIVDGLSEGVSMVDWCLYQKSASGVEEERIQVSSHRALDVWNNPNDHMTQDELVYAFNQHYDLVGEGWLHVLKPGGIPKQLWVVRPDRIAPVPHPELFISGYQYRTPEGQVIPLEIGEVMRVKRYNPLDPYRGMGAVQSVMYSMDGLRYGNEWNARFFQNDASPGVILEVAEGLNDPEYNRLMKRWDEKHRGIRRAHRPSVLEGGVKVVPNQYSMKDMQFQELNLLSREQIMEAFRYPKFMLGRVDDVNRANAEASEYVSSKSLLVPRLERMKKILNGQFLPMFGPQAARNLEFDFHSPVPKDEKTDAETTKLKTEAYKVLVDSGVEPEDAAAAVGLPPMKVVVRSTSTDVQKVKEDEDEYEAPRAQSRRVFYNQDEEELREQWQDRLDELVSEWGEVTEKQYEELQDQIVHAVDNEQIRDLSELEVDTDEAAAVLLAAMVAMSAVGANEVVNAAAIQGVEIQPVAASTEELSVLAATTTALLGMGLAASAGREALRILAPGSVGTQVGSAVLGHLRGLSDVFLRDQLGGALWAAEGAGRYSTLAAGPEASHYRASEVRDRNRCEPCKDVDGKKFYSLASARRAYPNGGYHNCKGGIRCRGTYEPVWESR